MKKIIFISFILASLFSAVSCGEKVSQTDIESSSEAEPVTEEETELPTDRVRDIVASEDFEYEIYENRAIVTKYIGSTTDVEVPAELGGAPVTDIGFYAFEANYNITSVVLPDTITLIGEGAFMDCGSMTSINIPEGVTEIERGAFVGCVSLEELTVPSSVVRIQEEAFTACENIGVLTINNPELEYENWGLEELDNIRIHAPEGSAVAQWAAEMGKLE